MKRYFLLAFLLFNLSPLFAQVCSPGIIGYWTQEDLDNFLVNYPGCTAIDGSVRLRENVTNIDNLSNITSISGSLQFFNTSIGASDFSAFSNLTYVGEDLNITSSNFTSLQGFEQLTTIGGNFFVTSYISSFQPLENLTTVGSDMLIQNNNITSLQGLEGLISIGGYLNITSNAITNLQGLENVETIGGNFWLYSNQVTNFQGLASLTTIEGDLVVAGNGVINCEGLENLTTINGGLKVTGDEIINFEGLENVTAIGEGVFTNSGAMTSLKGLENVISIGGHLEIESEGVSNFHDLENLTTIVGDLLIVNNSMTSLAGLEGLTSLGGLEVTGDGLSSIAALANVTSLGGNLYITNEALLSLNGLENITSIDGNLDIGASNLSSFQSLENVTRIQGSLKLNSNVNAQISNFEGLENLDTIGESLIVNYSILSSFQHLANLKYIGNDFVLYSCSNFTNFEGLENLTTIGGDLSIQYSNGFTQLDGFENLVTIGGKVVISNNGSIQNLNGIAGVQYQGVTDLHIYNNPALNACTNEFTCNYLNAGGLLNEGIPSFNITSACLDSWESDCNQVLGKVYHAVFNDLNENGNFEQGEPFYTLATLNIEPLGIVVYGNESQEGSTYLNFGDHTITLDTSLLSDWELTTDSVSFDFTINNTIDNDTLYFGIRPTANIAELKSSLVAPAFRCNESVTLDLFAENTGTISLDGTLWLQMDENIPEIVFVDLPDTTIAPNLYGWHFTNLYPGNKATEQVEIVIPGPPSFPLGDFISLDTWATFDGTNGLESSTEFVYDGLVECSYDPNDKLVNPVYPQNYALIGEDLVYTIRFQNTGNAEAYDVVIRDTLDINLDPSTFQIITSSHEAVLSTRLEENRYLSFSFIDIYLPDSTTNFEASQGYVSYRIRVEEDIPEETVISNTAAIYFDFNPAVITNTTSNVMLSSFDRDEDGFDIFIDCDDNDPLINPNATEIPGNDLDENCDGIIGRAISGRIFTADSLAIALVDVVLENTTTSTIGAETTLEDGLFSFASAGNGNDYAIKPSKEVNWTNGVTAFDLYTIQSHIVGLDTLSSDYKKIAADVFKDQQISSIDLAFLHQLLISLGTALPPNNTSWRFVPQTFAFATSNHAQVPSFPETIMIENFDTDSLRNDFVGVKIGNVVGPVDPTMFGASIEARSAKQLKLSIKDQKIKAGEVFNIDFHVDHFKDIVAYQWLLNFDPNRVDYLALEQQSLPSFSVNNIGDSFATKGQLSMLWYNTQAVSLIKNAKLFTLSFQAKEDLETLHGLFSIGGDELPTSVYKTDGLAMDIDFEMRRAAGEAVEFALYQNQPNPFQTSTYIGFSLPNATIARLKIFDMNGRMLKVIQRDFSAGYHEVELEQAVFPQSGVFYYQLESSTHAAIKKMIIIK